MNKLLIAALLGFTLLAVTAGNEDNNENSLQGVEAEVEQHREVREADPKNNGRKKHGKKGKNKNRNGTKKHGKKGKNKNRNGTKKHGKKGKNKNRNGKKKHGKKGKNKNRNGTKKQDKKRISKTRKDKKVKSVKGRSTACEMMDYCLNNATKYMNQQKEKYSNFIRQYNRISKFGKLNKNKGGKKGSFKGLANKIKEKGGNPTNSSGLKCQGSSTSPGAMTMKEVMDKLASCEDDIHKACMDGAPTANQTELDACKTKMDDFNTAAETCNKKKDDTKCTCWTGDDLKTKSAAIAKCNLKDTMDKFTTAKKKCTAAFSVCRQEEDKGNKVLFICDASQSTDNLIKKLNVLNTNVAAVEAMIKKVMAKVSRRVRSATCGSLAKDVDGVAEKAMKAPSSPAVKEAADAVKFPTSSCKGDAAVQASLAKAESGVAGMKELAETLQGEIKDQTGSTASSAQVESGGSSVTTASSVGRRNLNKMFFNLV